MLFWFATPQFNDSDTNNTVNKMLSAKKLTLEQGAIYIDPHVMTTTLGESWQQYWVSRLMTHSPEGATVALCSLHHKLLIAIVTQKMEQGDID